MSEESTVAIQQSPPTECTKQFCSDAPVYTLETDNVKAAFCSKHAEKMARLGKWNLTKESQKHVEQEFSHNDE